MLSSNEQPLSQTICRNLSDRSYEKRKQGALSIEQFIRQQNQQAILEEQETNNDKNKKSSKINETQSKLRIKRVITYLINTFIRSTQANHRKGGLIGLAGVALGLNRNTTLYLDIMLPAVCSLLEDQEARVRYYACESLYNISKVARDGLLEHFDRIFNGLCILFEDPDGNVKEAAALLDRLVKEIVVRTADQFNLDKFIPRLRAHMNNKHPYVRELLLQWIILLNNTPGIELLEYLSDFLDGLFEFLEDNKTEIVKQTDLILNDFLREITACIHIDLNPMILILIKQIKNIKYGNKRRYIGLLWLYEFLKLGQFRLSEFYPNILIVILDSINDTNQNIAIQSQKNNKELFSLVKGFNTLKNISLEKLKVYKLLEILCDKLQNTNISVKTKIESLNWICMILIYLNLDIKKIESKNNPLFPVLLNLVCDPDDNVLELTLKVLSQISIKNEYFDNILINLLISFKDRHNLLAIRGKLIIEKLCQLLGAKKIYLNISKKLIEDNNINITTSHINNSTDNNSNKQITSFKHDLQFCSLMVQSLNLILLTSNNNSIINLRKEINECKLNTENWNLFCNLFNTWCYNPIAILSLCLLGNVYTLGSKLVLYFANVDITIGFLMQVDKLISLIESPTFVHLRLQLLEPHQYPYLLKIMYGLLMLLPQNSAFNSLRIRLQCATQFGLLDCIPVKKVEMYQKQNKEIINNKKFNIDTDKLFEQFVKVNSEFQAQRLKEIEQSSFINKNKNKNKNINNNDEQKQNTLNINNNNNQLSKESLDMTDEFIEEIMDTVGVNDSNKSNKSNKINNSNNNSNKINNKVINNNNNNNNKQKFPKIKQNENINNENNTKLEINENSNSNNNINTNKDNV